MGGAVSGYGDSGRNVGGSSDGSSFKGSDVDSLEDVSSTTDGDQSGSDGDDLGSDGDQLGSDGVQFESEGGKKRRRRRRRRRGSGTVDHRLVVKIVKECL